MSALITRQSAVSGIRALIRKADTIPRPSKEQRAFFRQRLEKKLSEFEEAHHALRAAAEEGSGEDQAHVQLRDEIQTEVDDALFKLLEIDSEDEPRRSDSVSTTASSSHANDSRLEPIKIKTFDGQEKNWLHFRDLFEALVHKREDMDDALKLTRLRQYVDTDKVAALSGAYTGGYAEVWQEMLKRYDNKRKLVVSHMGELTVLPINPSESRATIEAVIDATRAMLRAMKALEFDTQSWGPMLYAIIIERLPQATRTHWHTLQRSDKIPSISEMLGDLQEYAENVPEPASQPNHNHERRTWRSLATTGLDRPSCPVCASSHGLADCSKFRSFSLEDRRGTVRETRACYLCLIPGHGIRVCRSRKQCNGCGRADHHELICDRGNQSGGAQSNTGQVGGRPQ